MSIIPRSLYGAMVALFALVRGTVRLFMYEPIEMTAATFQHMVGDKDAAQARVRDIIRRERGASS